MTVRGGGGLDGFSIVFTRRAADGLKRDDAVATAWIGGQGGSPQTFGGDGSLVVGIHGRRTDDPKNGPRCGGLGLVLVEPVPDTAR